MELVNQPKITGLMPLVKNADIFMGFAAMCILMVMILPIPPAVLDLLLSFNITFSLIVLMVGMYVLKPIDFSAFPSVLLLATLFRCPSTKSHIHSA